MTKTHQNPNTASREAELRREGACPVAKLATEAAAILRMGKRLGIETLFDSESEPEFKIDTDNHPIIRQMRAANNAPDFNVMIVGKALKDALDRHLRAAEAFAPQSLKGALFHLYLAGRITEIGFEDALDHRAPDLADMRREIELQQARLLHLSITALEALLPMGPDPDLIDLKRYLFNPAYQRHVLMQHVFELANAA